MKAVFLDKKNFSNTIDLTPVSKQVIQLTCFDMTHDKDIVHRCIDAEVILTNKAIN